MVAMELLSLECNRRAPTPSAERAERSRLNSHVSHHPGGFKIMGISLLLPTRRARRKQARSKVESRKARKSTNHKTKTTTKNSTAHRNYLVRCATFDWFSSVQGKARMLRRTFPIEMRVSGGIGATLWSDAFRRFCLLQQERWSKTNGRNGSWSLSLMKTFLGYTCPLMIPNLSPHRQPSNA